MVSLSGIAGISPLATSLGNLALISPQSTVGYQAIPLDQQGNPKKTLPSTLLFHLEGENNVTLKSDITDHYTENNSAINDQIARSPERITVQGFIGELNDVAVGAAAIAKQIADKLAILGGFLPSISTTALNAYNDAKTIYSTGASVYNSATTTLATINGEKQGANVIGSSGINTNIRNQNKQQIAFQQFYGYWYDKTLFTVQTPWAIFQNCAIESLTAVQSADTQEVSEFTVTFKVIRFAATNIAKKKNGRNATQAQTKKDMGKVAISTGNITVKNVVG